MKTILGLAALAAFVGLLPFAFADSKPTPSSRPEPAASVSRRPDAEKRAEHSKQRTEPSARKAEANAPTAERSLTAAQENKLLALLNEGNLEELDAIPGIARTRADSIVKARPFSDVREIALVDGIGDATYGKILAYGRNLAAWRESSAPTKARKS